jgi:tetratricopeptide (TPR) repeat protein
MSGFWRAWLPIFILVAAIWLVFGRTAIAQFVAWDDPDMVWQNSRLNPPTVAKTLEFWRTPDLGLYTPLPYTAWSAVAALEPRPSDQVLVAWPFHVLNILLHTLAAIFVFLLLRELIDMTWPAWAGAMIFAVHPLQVEPVGWVSGMNNLMCGAFAMAALLQYVRYAKDPAAPRHIVFATLFYVCALLSKPTAVTLPLIAAVIDCFLLRRPLRRVAPPIAFWVILAAPIVIVARLAQPSSSIQSPPISGRLLVAVDAIGFYLTKLFFPMNLAIDYQRTPQWLLAHPWAAWPGLAVLLPAAICFISRSSAWMRVGLLIIPIALLPVLGLTRFDFQAYSTVADRYMYIPMLGVAILGAMIMQRAKGHMIAWTLAGIILALLAARSVDQAGVWQNTQSLAGQEFRVDPDSATGHKILAFWLSSQHRDQEAQVQFQQAIAALTRTQSHPDGAVWFDYGNLLLRQGQYVEAIEQYQYAIPRLSAQKQPLAFNNLGIAFYRTGHSDAARSAFQAAIDLRPDYAEAKKNLELLPH